MKFYHANWLNSAVTTLTVVNIWQWIKDQLHTMSKTTESQMAETGTRDIICNMCTDTDMPIALLVLGNIIFIQLESGWTVYNKRAGDYTGSVSNKWQDHDVVLR